MNSGDELRREREQRQSPVPDDRPDRCGTPDRAAYGWLIGSAVVGSLLIGWFFLAWLALDRHFVDAVGETIGSAFAVLLLVSIVGAFRHRRDE